MGWAYYLDPFSRKNATHGSSRSCAPLLSVESPLNTFLASLLPKRETESGKEVADFHSRQVRRSSPCLSIRSGLALVGKDRPRRREAVLKQRENRAIGKLHPESRMLWKKQKQKEDADRSLNSHLASSQKSVFPFPSQKVSERKL